MPTFSKIQDDPTVASSHGSMRDSLRTTSNVESKGDAPINFSFRSTTSNEFDRLVNSGQSDNNAVNARNWSRPPNVSPGGTTPGQITAKKAAVGSKKGSNQSPAASVQGGGVSPRAAHAHNNSGGNNNHVSSSPAGNKNKNAGVSPSPAKKNNSTPAKASPKLSKAKAAEKNAIRRALGGGDDDDFDNEGGGGHELTRQGNSNSLENDSGVIPGGTANSMLSDSGMVPTPGNMKQKKKQSYAAFDQTAAGAGSSASQDGGGEEGEDDGANTAEGGATTTNEPGKSISSNSDSDPDSDYESMGGSSTSSASSNARRAKEMKARPIMLYMITLIAVPILFLTIYQAISVGTALAALKYMQDHSKPVLHMIELQSDLQDEMLLASALIGQRIARGLSGEEPLPSWVPQKMKDLDAQVHRYYESTRATLRTLLVEVSGGEGAIPGFHSKAVRLPESLSKAEIHANRNNGNAYRDELIYIMTEISTMLAILQRDDHAALFSVQLIDMQLLTRIEEYFVKLVAMYEEIEYGVNGSNIFWQDFRGGSHYVANVIATENSSSSSSSLNNGGGDSVITTSDSYYASITEYCLLFSKTYNRLTAYSDYLTVGSGDELVQSTLVEFMDTGFSTHKNAYRPFLDCSLYYAPNRNNVTWVAPEILDSWFTAERNKISAAIRSLFNSIIDNKEVQDGAVVEGMKLFAAIVCCIIGVVIVISIQKKERTELFKIIDHSERLSTAVRRFVPKNQLRMMGVRSVLQVSPGFNVEVANTLVSSSIGSFEQIAETMSRLELFDWLQMYVARITYVVQQSRGYIDGIRGDRILSVFSQGTDGVTASVMMQQEADHMNVDLIATKATELIKINVGVHHCIHVGGMVGDDNRLACVLVSSDVNLCSRLEGLTKIYKNRIIISRASYDQIDPSLFEIRTLGHIEGIPCECFDLYQADDPELKAFKNLTKEDFETAVGIMSNSNPIERKGANTIFENLKTKANMMNLTDHTVLQKLRELSNTAPNTPAMSGGGNELPIIVPTSPTSGGTSQRGTVDSTRHSAVSNSNTADPDHTHTNSNHNLPHSVAGLG